MAEHQEMQTGQRGLLPLDPITIVRDILRRWYLVAAAALIAGMAAYMIAGFCYVPAYQTTTTFVVSARGSSTTVYQNLSAATNLAAVFSEVLNSSLLRTAILEELGLDSFDGTITASAIPETNLLTLNVTDDDPRTAFLVTRSIIENHSIVSYQVLGDTILEVLQQPSVPTAPVNDAGRGSSMKRAAVLAGAAVCVLLGALSAAKDTVRSREEAARKLDCRVLGTVRHERKYKTLRALRRRQKTSILLDNPATSFLFAETIRKLRYRVERNMADGKVLMLTSVTENEGKSTLAVNLALAMVKKDKKVLLIDGDLRKPACHKILEFAWKRPGTAAAAKGQLPLREAAVRIGERGLYVLLERKGVPSSTDISGSEGMASLIRQARAQFDFVVIDTPPMSAAPDAECIMELADASVMVIQQNVVTADVLNSAIDTLRGGRARFLGCVLNNVYGDLSGEGGYSYGYGYGRYGKYGKYGKYGAYGKRGTPGEDGT